jgi:TonB-dependent receptor
VDSQKISRAAKSSAYLSLCVAAALSQGAFAQSAKNSTASGSGDGLEELVVTGYRKSLSESTDFKKESVGFVEGVFAEDMGKFPDTNAAESLNRIPGVTISREITGEGLNVSIRGLGTSFVKILLNDAPVAIASTGRTDSQNTNREVDLDILPTEFFTQMTVSKSPSAGTLEGGPGGTINMRTTRPFDNPGAHLTYAIQGTKQAHSKTGARGSIVASDTWGNFGVLLGVAATRNNIDVKGYETIGWTNPNLRSAASNFTTSAGNPNGFTDVDPNTAGVQVSVGPTCTGTCNSTGGGNFTLPGLMPVTAGGIGIDTPIDSAFTLANNPGLTTNQLDNGLIPRLSRPMEEFGKKERVSAALSLEYKPSENLHVFVDSMYGRRHNDFQRIDMNWVVRNGNSAVPINETVDRSDCTNGCVVNSVTFVNSQFFLEYRPYKEDVKFWSFNPGLEWKINDAVKLDVQANDTDSKFTRESPTVLVSTAPNSGVIVNFVNGLVPSVTSNVDLNNPANFGWPGGRVNIQDEVRETKTKGARGNLTVDFGKTGLSLKTGFAYDDVSRRIRPLDNTQFWQNAVCGGQPSTNLPAPNSQPPCQGLAAANITAGSGGYPNYPGYGTNYTAGFPAFSYLGSLIPNTSIASYLKPGPSGFITVDWDSFRAASQYDKYHAGATQNASANTGAGGGFIGEKSTGFYLQLNGDTKLGDTRVKYTVGNRWVKTKQTVLGTLSVGDPRNSLPTTPPSTLADGARYPNTVDYDFNDPNSPATTTYSNSLPSLELAVYATENAVFKAAASKSMGRADPSALLPGLNSSAPSADVFPLGNPNLKPFISENLDFGFEYYLGHEGYVGIMGFRKRMTGFTISQNTTVPFSALNAYGVNYNTLTATQQGAINGRGGPGAATVVLQQQINAAGALIINGIEFNWVQPLDKLLHIPALEGMGITANYTVVDQQGSGAAPATAVGVPPHTFNLTGYYEKNGVSLRLSQVFYAENVATGTNQNGLVNGAAVYNDVYRQWDFSSSFDIGKLFHLGNAPEITFDVQNLFSAKQRQYFQYKNATFTQYEPGRFYMLGLRQKF